MPEKTKKEAKKIHPVKEDEAVLWEKATKDVKPIANKAVRTPPEPPLRKRAGTKHNTKMAPISDERVPVRSTTTQKAADEKSGRQMAASQKKKLKEGKIKIDAKLDLHGMSVAVAHRELIRFLSAASSGQSRCLLVITGKGSNDKGREGKGVLKQNLEGWIMGSKIAPMVLSIISAARHHGGEGAFYVYLRRKES